MVSREDVERRAHELFAAQADEALAWVDRFGSAPSANEVNRVRLAILEVSDGRLSRLPYFVACAVIDYRDLLTGARMSAMSEADEAAWQARTARQLAAWRRQYPQVQGLPDVE